MRKDSATHRVAVAITPQAPIFELAVPCEIFGTDRPELADPWYHLDVCSTEPDTTVAAGFVAHGAASMVELARADTVIVPACANVHTRPPEKLVEAVRTAHEAGSRIAGICSGAFVLAAAGILDGRRSTAHWMHAQELARLYPRVHVDPTVLYCEDGGVFTSAGTAAGIDLCLELVRRDHGTAITNALARRLVVPPHRDGGQAQYMRLPAVTPDDTSLAPLLDWARARLDQPLSVDDLAQHGHLSRRTLARRFHDTLGLAPLRWLRHERIRHAQHLLETTTMTVDHIAARSGLGTAANLRRHFTDHVGVSPHGYRRTFRTTRS
ncbi:AraC family transcriptional activator FtrA [Saccharopolyspora lacisalsi]|uniref:AraC family transcriptional activator FtrA n=1 Tax=Halosaccharopolyspora lacisalsi TaxID=1000566 RepID=A0A839DVE1_9PSEU|nr:helix-turn-helix domain-containing protein [Halosaccharopolyspora lacisalsi]MBA8825013.1 AraC family transcriptional activator FtrA [Halosaccharopolyspora lacisalsi]